MVSTFLQYLTSQRALIAVEKFAVVLVSGLYLFTGRVNK